MLGPSRYFFLPAVLVLAGTAFSTAVLSQAPAQSSHRALLTPPNPASSLNQLPPALATAAVPSAGVRAQSSDLSHEQLGDIAAAHRHFRAAIAAYAQAPQMTAALWDKSGIAYEMLHDFGDAMRCYRNALKLDPNFPQVYNNLGSLYGLVRNFGKADHMYRMALKLDPNSPRFLMNFGTNLIALHKFAAGWEAYRHALALDPAVFNDAGGPAVGNAASVHNRGAMYYYIALGCTRTSDAGCAVENLRAAIDRGFVSPKEIASDTRFAALNGNPAFQRLLTEESTR